MFSAASDGLPTTAVRISSADADSQERRLAGELQAGASPVPQRGAESAAHPAKQTGAGLLGQLIIRGACDNRGQLLPLDDQAGADFHPQSCLAEEAHAAFTLPE